jgi:hypothetical protein
LLRGPTGYVGRFDLSDYGANDWGRRIRGKF